uniref:Uncharacterized protein n=1 Tax=Amphimedon queenslandica TaxID=400682 RepID=A0A1X7UA79_AMPQE
MNSTRLAANPRERLKFNVLARIFFCWVDPLFWLGCRRSLEVSDLYERPSEADSNELLAKFNKYWKLELKRKKYGGSPRMLLILFKMFWGYHFKQGLFLFLEVGCFITMSEMIGLLADYFTLSSPSIDDTRDAYLYAMGLALLSLAIVFFHAYNFHASYLLGMLTRITMTSALYQKILSLSQSTVSQKTIGHIVNLVSNDVHKFDLPFLFCHYYWIGPIHIVVVTYLLYLELQWSAFVATALVLLQIPLQLTIAYFSSKLRLNAAKMTDRRVKVMNEVISGIRVIKMYAWEYAFSNVVAAIRKSEIYLIAKYFMVQAIGLTCDTVTVSFIMFCLFTVYVNTPDAQITPRKVFIAFSFLSFLRISLLQTSISVIQQAAAVVAGRRIKNFLLLDELEQFLDSDSSNEYIALESLSSPNEEHTNIVKVQGLTASWSLDSDKLTLNDVSFTVNKEKPLLAIVGSVGCGKSTLLQCLLKELPALSGTVMVKGSVGAVYRQADVYLLDDPLSAVDAAVSRHLFERCISGILSDKIVILVTHQLQYLEQCDTVLGLKEGCIAVYGDTDEVLKDNSTIMELLADNVDKPSYDFNVRSASKAGLEESPFDNNEKDLEIELKANQLKADTAAAQKTSVPPEERAHGTVSTKTYIRYFLTGGGYLFTLVIVLIYLSTEANFVTADWWISNWAYCESDSNDSSSICSLTDNQRIGIYGGLIGSLAVFAGLRSTLFFFLMLNSARIVHNKMFARVLRAPILFFDTNPIGRVLNRFSKDVGFLDDELPFYFSLYLLLLVRFCAIMITASIANPLVLIAVGVVFIVSILFRWYYLNTARDIKRLEAMTRSPVYSHLSLTLQGLPTIRSYSMQTEAMNLFYKFQDQHTQASYLYIVTNRWFGMRLDVLSTLFITFVAFGSVPLSSTLDAGLVGLALTYSISLNGAFQGCIRSGTEVESFMVSAERVMAYGQLETESSLETDPSVSLSSEWPTKGHIELKDVSYCHSNEGPLVLKGITCDIKPSEKIGIVGRTGAGKSSLIGALFRLAEPTGSIKIDGVELSQLGLHDVRSNISIIPQDPVLFGASVRYNLDPFQEYDDDRIWKSLEQVQLKNVVDGLEGKLESDVSEGGANFSVGQRQLFCLARALLQNNTIIILDEATANVDLETDAIIQQVIRKQFSGSTVLTIAHRLDTVMDSNRIMVLRSGQLVEFDVPHLLLSDSSSYLSKLVQQTGAISDTKLRNIAFESYHKHSIEGQ